MKEIFDFLKSLVFALIIVVLLQIRLGGETLEEVTTRTVRESSIGSYLTEVAQGGVKVVANLYAAVIGQVDSKLTDKFNSEKIPGRRKLIDAFERSKGFIEDEKLKAERDTILREYREAEQSLEN